MGIAELSYGRIRPLHTNAVIFAFAGNAIFVGVYYSLQRLCKARMFSDFLIKSISGAGKQLLLLLLLRFPLDLLQVGHGELEWPIDILITLIWVVFGTNMMGTIFKRREKHIYVAIWFS